MGIDINVKGGYTFLYGEAHEEKEAVKLLKNAGFTMLQGKGDHAKWEKGGVMVVITDSKELSPGIVRQVLDAIEKS